MAVCPRRVILVLGLLCPSQAFVIPSPARSPDLVSVIENRNRVASESILREWSKFAMEVAAEEMPEGTVAAAETVAPGTRVALFEAEAARLLREAAGPAAMRNYEADSIRRPFRAAARFVRWFCAAWPRPEAKQHKPLQERIIAR